MPRKLLNPLPIRPTPEYPVYTGRIHYYEPLTAAQIADSLDYQARFHQMTLTQILLKTHSFMPGHQFKPDPLKADQLTFVVDESESLAHMHEFVSDRCRCSAPGFYPYQYQSKRRLRGK